MKHQVVHRGWRYPRVTTGAIVTWIATVLLAPASGNGWIAVVNGVAVLVLAIVVVLNLYCWLRHSRSRA